MNLSNTKHETLFSIPGVPWPAVVRMAIRKKMVLTGLMIHSRDLSGQKLARLKAPEASVINVNFRYADLRGVDFTGAEIKHCDFGGAKLDGASFRNALVTDCQFHAEEVSGVDFEGTYFGKKGGKPWDGPTMFHKDPRLEEDDDD